jgi:hypothetical protein
MTCLLKLRAERRKQEIGFERKKRREAELARKQEAHEAKTRFFRGVVEARLPGHTAHPLQPSQDVLSSAITNSVAELDADPKLAKMLKAA